MITSYEDLIVWQKANQLAERVFNMTEGFPRKYLYDLTSQLRRAALSVPTNIAEGCASFHSKEFLQLLNISRRSLSETQYLLGFSSSRNLITETELL
jgi:four helix bundle protein